MFKEQHRPPRDGDEIITAFRDGRVTLRSNRRTEGFTNASLELGYQGIREGDLVIHSMDGFAGAIGISDSDGKASPVVHAWRAAPEVDARYYAYLLRVFAQRGFITSLAKGIRERSTAFDAQTFKALRLPHPPLMAQRRIADYLDIETARIDSLIEKKRRMTGLLEERFETDLAQFAVGSNEQVTDNPLYPTLGSDRTLWRVKHVATKIGSGKTPLGGSESYVADGVPFLRSQNVLMGRLSLDDCVYIEPTVDEDMRTTRVHPGDVLLNITGGSLGRCAFAPAGLAAANVNQHVCIIRPIARVKSRLLHYVLRSRHVQEQIRQEQVGGNRDGLNFEQVGNLVVALPTTAAGQAELELQMVHKEETHWRAVASLDAQARLLNEHRLALITAAVTGELQVAEAS